MQCKIWKDGKCERKTKVILRKAASIEYREEFSAIHKTNQ